MEVKEEMWRGRRRCEDEGGVVEVKKERWDVKVKEEMWR